MTTELIDLREIDLRLDDAGRDTADPAFAAAVDRADGLILVVPEYNGSYPGLLEHALDTLIEGVPAQVGRSCHGRLSQR